MNPSASAATIDLPTSARMAFAADRLSRSEAGTRDDTRWILYERLSGAAARERAERPSPEGAGLPPEAAHAVEYVEVWGRPGDSRGYDLRMYSFGGRLVAFRNVASTRSEISRPPTDRQS